VALYANIDNYSGQLQAMRGSSGSQHGGPGTVYIDDGTTTILRVDNGGNNQRSAALPAGEYAFGTVHLTGSGDLVVLDSTSVITFTGTDSVTGDGSGRLIGQGTIVAPSAFTIEGATVGVQGRLVGGGVITTTGSGGLELYGSTPWHSGVYTFTSLHIGNGTRVSLISHVNSNEIYADDYGVELRVNSLTIAEGGRLAADESGYTSGPGAGSGRTGGGYGGFGGGSTATAGLPYGDPYQPTHLGSRGGTGGAGGGAMRLVVANDVIVDGTISANGGRGNQYQGGGSGGSIWIEAAAVSGAGLIQANGGQGGSGSIGQDGGYSGGGGRVALYANIDNYSGQLQAMRGSSGSQHGGPGTVYIDDGTTTILRVDNGGNNQRSAALPAGNYAFGTVHLTGSGDLVVLDSTSVITFTGTDSVTGDGSGRLIGQGTIVAPSAFTIEGATVGVQGRLVGGGVITTTGSGGLELYGSTPWHSGVYTFTSLHIGDNTAVNLIPHVVNSEEDSYGVELRLDRLTIATGGLLATDEGGYLVGPGAGSGRTGGGYGGYGGNSTATAGLPYGDPYQPTHLGSRGGTGGAGGGAMRLVVANDCDR
jgi:large repetitive protein